MFQGKTTLSDTPFSTRRTKWLLILFQITVFYDVCKKKRPTFWRHNWDELLSSFVRITAGHWIISPLTNPYQTDLYHRRETNSLIIFITLLFLNEKVWLPADPKTWPLIWLRFKTMQSYTDVNFTSWVRSHVYDFYFLWDVVRLPVEKNWI